MVSLKSMYGLSEVYVWSLWGLCMVSLKSMCGLSEVYVWSL